MSTDITGGPAFPFATAHDVMCSGMTLRDYFAAMAMQAFLRNRKPHLTDAFFDEWAHDAYEMADAMLQVREAA